MTRTHNRVVPRARTAVPGSSAHGDICGCIADIAYLCLATRQAPSPHQRLLQSLSANVVPTKGVRRSEECRFDLRRSQTLCLQKSSWKLDFLGRRRQGLSTHDVTST